MRMQWYRLWTLGLAPVAYAASLFSTGIAAACTLEIGETGLGELTTTTRFESDAIAQALPGCRVTPMTGWSEGDPVDVLLVTDGQAQLALVFPDWTGRIYSVVIDSPSVRNRLGPAIGTRFEQAYGGSTPPVCVPGTEEATGRVLCQATPEGRLVYVFEGQWTGPDDTLPPAQELARWRIATIVWRSVPLEDPRWVDVGGFDPGEGPGLAEQVRRSVDDPASLSQLVIYPIVLHHLVAERQEQVAIPDAATFLVEYPRRLTTGFVSAVRAESIQAILINDNGAALAGGRIWIAPVCITDSCAEHRAGIISINMF